MKERTYRIWKWLAVALAILFLAAAGVSAILAYRLRPAPREKAIELLEKRFDDVRLGKLDLRILPRLGLPYVIATGEGLSLGLPGREGAPPFITMDRFTVSVWILDLLRDPIRIRSLELDTLQLQIPPKEDEDGDEEGEPDEDENESPPVFLIEKLVADGTVLRILPQDPEKAPLEFDLHHLRVQSVGVDSPMEFQSLLQNAKPPGEIDTTGTFGPLRLDEPGLTPVSGTYVFQEADLSVFKGIAGILYSEGEFSGALGRIEVHGFTETPDFRLTSAGNPVHLKTEFDAIVDGTSGDTLLQPVDATLESSRFRTRGGVAETPGTEGKTVSLDAETVDGRIEDFLRLAMKSESPFLTGDIRFNAKIVIPPGDVDVVEKIELDGQFEIDSARFTDPRVQERVTKLSDFGKGKEGSEDARADPAPDAERVLSNLSGTFHLQDGVMTLGGLSFGVPGAEVRFAGTYGLVSEEIDLRGELRLEATLSEATTGIKSFFLKLVDPLFRKEDAGAVIPIKVEGTRKQPDLGVDVGRVITRK